LNYLAHLFLSPPGEDAMLGSLMGDFVKGPLTNHTISGRYSADMTQAIALHRKIDGYTDSHPVVRESWNRVSKGRRRFAGVMVDIFYDHFLAANWRDYSPVPLESYAADFYTLLQSSHQQLPTGLKQIAPRMIEYNWLVSYQHREVVGKALHRIAQRLSRPLPLAEGVDDLDTHEISLRQDFAGFMDEAKIFVQEEFGITVR